MRILAGLALGLSLPVLCAALGGFIGGRLSRGVGWDQLANFLGGAALGIGVGVAVAVALVRRLEARRLLAVAGLTTLLAAILLAVVAWRIRERSAASHASALARVVARLRQDAVVHHCCSATTVGTAWYGAPSPSGRDHGSSLSA